MNNEQLVQAGVLFDEGVELFLTSKYIEAIKRFEAAASMGEERAIDFLPLINIKGGGLDINSAEICFSYILALRGSAEDQSNLGYSYFHGRGVEKNKEKGVFWYEKAAEQGNIDALFNLGVCYETGDAKEKNQDKANVYYLLAAEKGHVIAMFNLASNYYNGAGLEKDEEKAIDWWKRAADTGFAHAQMTLGFVYYNREDYKEAASWLQIASDAGLEQATNVLNSMRNKGLV